MKPSLLALISVFFLGVGFVLGGYVVPRSVGFSKFRSTPLSDEPSSSSTGVNASSTELDQQHQSMQAVDPQKLISILSDTNQFRRTKNLVDYFDTLSAEDIPGVFHQILAGPDDGKLQATDLLTERWVEVDVKGAEAAIGTTDKSMSKDNLISAVYGAMSRQDAGGALRQAEQVADKDDQRTALDSFYFTLARRDPAQAFSLFQAKDDDRWHQVLSDIFAEWAKKDVGQATQAAISLSDTEQRSNAIGQIWRPVFDKDPQSAAAWLNQLPEGDVRNAVRKDMVNAWASKDVQAAIDYINTLPEDMAKTDLIRNTALTLSEANPKGALALVDNLPPSSEADSARTQVLAGWGKSDPKATADYVNTLPQNIDSPKIYSVLAMQWLNKDPTTALAWLSQLPDGRSKDEAYRLGFGSWSSNNLSQAATYVESLPDGTAKQNTIGIVAQQMTQKDATSAVQWLAKFPDDQSKSAAYAAVAGTWAHSDPVQASAWLTQLPSGASRDAAVQSFSGEIVSTDPASADQWAESISDPKARQDQVKTVLQTWMQADPTNASVAVQKSSLPDDLKHQLLLTVHN